MSTLAFQLLVERERLADLWSDKDLFWAWGHIDKFHRHAREQVREVRRLRSLISSEQPVAGVAYFEWCGGGQETDVQ